MTQSQNNYAFAWLNHRYSLLSGISFANWSKIDNFFQIEYMYVHLKLTSWIGDALDLI
jgi:hypothetical protein